MQQEKKMLPPELQILLLQFSAVALIFISITVIKFFGHNLFEDIKNWYQINFCTDTSINEVILSEKNTQTTEPLPVPESNEVAEEIISEQVVPTLATTVIKLENTSDTNSMCLPLENYQISSPFSSRINPVTKKWEKHKGIDLSANKGEPIYAALTGMVETVKNSSSYGKCIIINHGNGLKTLYAHCSAIYKNQGESVIKGEKIAAVGNTGQSTRPHLHFEVIQNGEYINPEWVMSW